MFRKDFRKAEKCIIKMHHHAIHNNVITPSRETFSRVVGKNELRCFCLYQRYKFARFDRAFMFMSDAGRRKSSWETLRMGWLLLMQRGGRKRERDEGGKGEKKNRGWRKRRLRRRERWGDYFRDVLSIAMPVAGELIRGIKLTPCLQFNDCEIK